MKCAEMRYCVWKPSALLTNSVNVLGLVDLVGSIRFGWSDVLCFSGKITLRYMECEFGAKDYHPVCLWLIRIGLDGNDSGTLGQEWYGTFGINSLFLISLRLFFLIQAFTSYISADRGKVIEILYLNIQDQLCCRTGKQRTTLLRFSTTHVEHFRNSTGSKRAQRVHPLKSVFKQFHVLHVAVRPAQTHGCETWPFLVEDIRILVVFNY